MCALQEIKDTVDGQRILEKKGSSAVSGGRPQRQQSEAKERQQVRESERERERENKQEKRRMSGGGLGGLVMSQLIFLCSISHPPF